MTDIFVGILKRFFCNCDMCEPAHHCRNWKFPMPFILIRQETSSRRALRRKNDNIDINTTTTHNYPQAYSHTHTKIHTHRLRLQRQFCHIYFLPRKTAGFHIPWCHRPFSDVLSRGSASKRNPWALSNNFNK